MKTIYRTIYLFLFILPFITMAQQRWEVIIGQQNSDDFSLDVTESYDKGYLISGNYAQYNGWLIKTDINGSLLWDKVFYSKFEHMLGEAVAQNSNGEIAIAGHLGGNAFVAKLDKCGELAWCNKLVNENLDGSTIFDIIFKENNIIALTYSNDINTFLDRISLMYFDVDGLLLWKQEYARRNDYPLMNLRLPLYLNEFESDYYITGLCYYPFPDGGPNVYMRPLFIKIDSLFNEEWVLPYGIADSVYGAAGGVLLKNYNTITAAGLSYMTEDTRSLFMNVGMDGIEKGFKTLSGSEIGENVNQNVSYDNKLVSDSILLAGSEFEISSNFEPYGAMLLDTSFNVFGYQYNQLTIPDNKMQQTYNNDFVFSSNTLENNGKRDILLYKIKSNLSNAEYDTITYVYDSLCDHQIVSDTIRLDECGIITDLKEIPTPTEYYSYISTIPVRIFPNPATSGITFEFENTEYHTNILLRCYDINGKIVFEQALPPGQTQIKTSVSNWQSGIYVAVAISRTGGTGKGKFVVR